ncbi:hypothetical protein ISS05_04115 [Candidatus Woesearchaeota archaeon]|nr:hypothetical protein [Candidatus Woesearchaeota archaeon]
MYKLKGVDSNQLSLFEQPDENKNVTTQHPNLDNVVLFHKQNFKIEVPYLLEHLPQYNRYLKQEWHRDLENDNLLLRTMLGGIENSWGTPPEIFEGLNALETCLNEAGIFKRKYKHLEEFWIQPKGYPPKEPILVKKDPSPDKGSRIKTENDLDSWSLYETIDYLLNATQIGPIYRKYRRDWKKIFQAKNPEKKQKRFKRLNPYDPSTLKERMDYTEREYPDAVKKFKIALALEFIPERIVVKMDKYGSPVKIKNKEGFVTPGKTYRRGVKGRSFYNLREYANQVQNYFQRKEKEMQIKRE